MKQYLKKLNFLMRSSDLFSYLLISFRQPNEVYIFHDTSHPLFSLTILNSKSLPGFTLVLTSVCTILIQNVFHQKYMEN